MARTKREWITINVPLEPPEYDAVRQYAKRHGLPHCEVLRSALREKLVLEGRYYIELEPGKFRQVRGLM